MRVAEPVLSDLLRSGHTVAASVDVVPLPHVEAVGNIDELATAIKDQGNTVRDAFVTLPAGFYRRVGLLLETT